MTATISKRLQKLAKAAEADTYTKEEFELLYNLLGEDESKTLYDRIKGAKPELDYGSLQTALWELMKCGKYVLDDPDHTVNFYQYLLVYHRKLFLFLACVPLKRVSLYVGRKGLEVFVYWRLKINK